MFARMLLCCAAIMAAGGVALVRADDPLDRVSSSPLPPPAPPGTNVLDLKSGGPIAPGLQDAREGNVLFRMPRDWTRKNTEGMATLGPPNTPDGQHYEVRILDGAEDATTPRQFIAAALENLKQKYKIINTTEVENRRQPGGWESSAISMNLDTGGKVESWTLYVAKAGNRLQPILYVSTDWNLWKNNLPVIERFISSLRFANLIVLDKGDTAKGIPPLTLFDVNEEADFLEWLVAVPFTEGQRAQFLQIILSDWMKRDKASVDDAKGVLATARQFRELPADKRNFAREAALAQMLPEWRKQAPSDPACKLLVEIHDAGHSPIAAGNPPLTRQAADAFLETVYFMAGQLEGVSNVAPTVEEKEQWASKIASVYGKMNGEQQKFFANMPIVWAALRAGWPEMSTEQKGAALGQFASFEPVQVVRGQIAQARQMADAQRAQAAAQQRPRQSVQATADNPIPAGTDPRNVTPEQREAAYQAAMARLQSSHSTFMSLSNMSYSMHTANMAQISNIGGNNGYRWVYKP
jgi:hypothetical protein